MGRPHDSAIPCEAAPFQARVLANYILTDAESTSEKRHVEVSLRGSGVAYEPGDTLTIVPRNDPALVAALLARLGISEHTAIAVEGRQMHFGEALATQFEIAVATPRFLRNWADLSGSAELRALAAPDNVENRRHYLQDHHIGDIVRFYPVPGLDAEQVLAGLRPLQPRRYSIASSPAVDDRLAAITATTVRYRLHGEIRCRSKTYVQHRLLERGSDIYSWLKDGASFYVCGDAARMAPAFYGALIEIIETHGGTDRHGAIDYVRELARTRRYCRSIY